MNERLDACVAETNEKTGKTYWTNIGTAFAGKNGGWNIVLKAHPIGNKLSLFVPKERSDGPSKATQSSFGDDDFPL